MKTADRRLLVAKEMLSYGRTADIKKPIVFTPDKGADEFVKSDALAFVFGVILDHHIPAERAWASPYELRSRLGHWDIRRIAKMSDDEIERLFGMPPKLHRYWRVCARRIRNAGRLILQWYDGDAENIWRDNPRSDDLRRRFEEFDGIGQKKASMATNILARDLGVPVRFRQGIDVSYDAHVSRVFLRSGLVQKDSEEAVIQAARELNPDYPGELDLPAWLIGREWCHLTNPACDNCALVTVCPKVGI